MIDIEAAARYPLEDDGWTGTVGIGGLLVFLNFLLGTVGVFVVVILSALTLGLGLLLFVPLLLLQALLGVPVLGYGIRVLRSTIGGADVPPRFDDWGSLLRDGLYGYGIGLVYALPMIVVSGAFFALFLVGGLALGGAGDHSGGGSALMAVGQLVFSLVTMVYTVVAGYFAPISFAVYAREESLRAAFSPDRIREVATTSEYAIPWVVGAAVLMLVNNVAGFLTLFVVGAFLQFYGIVVAFRLFGQGYAAALGIDPDGEADAPADPTPADSRV